MKKVKKYSFSGYLNSVKTHQEVSDFMLSAIKKSNSKIKSLAQFRVLSALYEKDAPVKCTKAANDALIHGPSLSRMSKALHDLKLIKFSKNKLDPRERLISITAKGKKEFLAVLKACS